MRSSTHCRDELLDDVFDQVGPILADLNVLKDKKVTWSPWFSYLSSSVTCSQMSENALSI